MGGTSGCSGTGHPASRPTSAHRRPPGGRNARNGRHPARRHPLPLAVFVLLTVFPSPAAAQQFGQWSWEALAALGGRSHETFQDGQGGTQFDETSLRVLFGLHGFIVHPSVTRFHLATDLQYLRTGGEDKLDTYRSGLRADFDLFPSSPYRGSLYFNRQFYDYSGADDDEPFALLGAPDVLTTYGGRFRAARGFLKGSLLGFDRNTIDFLDHGTREQKRNVEYFDWSRSMGRFSNHVRLEHRFRDLGTLDQQLEELRFHLDENGNFSPTWHWSLSASAVRQEIETYQTIRTQLDDYQLRTRLVHDVREDDLLELDYVFGMTQPDTRASSDSHGLSVAYQWRLGAGWHLGPLVSYSRVSSDLERVQSGRAGLIFGWRWNRSLWDSGFTTRIGYGGVERDLAGMTQTEKDFAGSFIGNLGHGTMKGLRKEFEVEVVRNRLRITQTDLLTLPGLGLPLPGLGTEDSRRARVILGHQWDSQFLNAWFDWTERETDAILSSQDTRTETLSATLQYGSHAFDLKGTIAETDVEQGFLGPQSVRSLGLGANWRPWRSVTLRASYRSDQRDLLLAPDGEGTQREIGVRWQLGQFFVDVSYLQTVQTLAGGPETELRSLTWSVSRRFGGWLPIVTGPQRRGVIR